jgi:hypothetical protein
LSILHDVLFLLPDGETEKTRRTCEYAVLNGPLEDDQNGCDYFSFITQLYRDFIFTSEYEQNTRHKPQIPSRMPVEERPAARRNNRNTVAVAHNVQTTLTILQADGIPNLDFYTVLLEVIYCLDPGE